MTNSQITSLHSPHIEAVKALLGSRGKKYRQASKTFVADGLQSVREALDPKFVQAPKMEKLYVTESGLAKLTAEVAPSILEKVEIFSVTDAVMNAMAETENPQGILALCSYTEFTLYKLAQLQPKRLAYFWEIQDPGNSGTVIRTADACGYDAVIFSERSVDVYSPKTVRATVGSLWHIPVLESVSLADLAQFSQEHGFTSVALAGDGNRSILELESPEKSLLVFGNEARGLPDLPEEIERVHIPMLGHTESLNVASAAAISMFHIAFHTGHSSL